MTRGELQAVILAALVGILVVCLNIGCSHLQTAKEACAVPETRKEAAKLVVPRLASSLMCAVEHESDEELLACVRGEFESLKQETKPMVYSCALALAHDAIEAAQK